MVVKSGKVEYRFIRSWFAEEKRFCLTKCPDLVDHYSLKLTNLRSCEQITLSSLQVSIYGKGDYMGCICLYSNPKRPRGWHRDDANPLFYMALPTGVEPVACPLGGDRSILLSYGSCVAGIIQEATPF